MRRTVEGTSLVFILLAVGALSWWLMLRPVNEADPARFDTLPTELNGWRAFDIEIDQSVSEMLAADHNVQRAYVHPLRYVVYVYVGYYGTRRGGTPEHTPDVCYPSQGWQIVEASDRRVGGVGGFDLREFVVEQNQERRLVHFWYRTSEETGITSVLELRLRHFWGRLWHNRAEGALVRMSTAIIDEDIDAARVRLIGMDHVVEAELAALWQAEAPPSS